ncbi:MFS transporter [Kineococcus endophyticus]|uniref:MFS transporter n=1 Tax=Kineococcus endophyticus TaxID=1181883 RepID=A0ABV3P284_9ACTN
MTGTAVPSDSTTGPYRLTTRTLVAAAGGIFVAQVALAMPAVLNGLFQQDLGTSASQLTWISDAYFVPVALFTLAFGVLGDLHGRRRLLLAGAAVLAVGEVVGMLTPVSGDQGLRVGWLLTGQVLCGLGAAAIMPTSLAMVAAGTHTARDRSRAIGVWAAALATGSFVSPVVGGFLAKFAFRGSETGSWRWAFLAAAVLALVSLVLTARLAEESSSPEGRSMDWPGQAAISVALFCLLFGTIQGSSSGWGSPLVVGAYVVSLAAFAAFVRIEHRSPSPLVRLDLFAGRGFSLTALATVVGMFGYLGCAYSSSIRLSAIQGFSPLTTSVAFVLLNGSTLVFARPVSHLMERWGARWTMVTGFGLMAVGCFWAAAVPASTMSVALIAAPVAVVGLGFALALNAVSAAAVDAAPPHLAGMAGGTASLLRDFGFTLGPAVIGSIALSRAADSIAERLAADASLRQALATFSAAPDAATGAQKAALEAAVEAVQSGPLGANAVPGTIEVDGTSVPFNPLKDVAFAALDHAYAFGYVVCGVATLVAAVLAVLAVSTPTRPAEEAATPAHA